MIFRITPAGALTSLYGFCSRTNCSDGQDPVGGLVQAPNGDFYGTTVEGGTGGRGTVFRIDPNGRLSTLYSFCSQSKCVDGNNPYAAPIRATDGNFYGTTYWGGVYGHGTIFRITGKGSLTTLYSFCSQTDCEDGSLPTAALVQDTNGALYGTTFYGGENDSGAVFSLSVGLGAFLETQPTSAKVGKPINILGTNLTGATSVMFNGTSATFTVVSPSLIRTTVPAGATTGTVQVVTPGGTFKSNVPFRVIH